MIENIKDITLGQVGVFSIRFIFVAIITVFIMFLIGMSSMLFALLLDEELTFLFMGNCYMTMCAVFCFLFIWNQFYRDEQ